MADRIAGFEVERNVAGGEHQVTVYVDQRAANVGGQDYLTIVDLTAQQAEALAEILTIHAERALCWQCGVYPSMPGDLCPRCEEASGR